MNLYNEIMNIPSNRCKDFKDDSYAITYKIGHKDARHVAAELALEQDRFIERLEQAAKRYEYIRTLSPPQF